MANDSIIQSPWHVAADKVPERVESLEPDETAFRKNDGDKPRFDLIDPVFLEEVAIALAMGARKYGDNNWRNGARWGRYFAAAMRHSWAWWRGQTIDPESGVSALAHAAASLMILFCLHRSYGAQPARSEHDDRPL